MKLFTEPIKGSNNYEPASLTEEETKLAKDIAECQAMAFRLQRLLKSCTHRVWYDQAGHPYDVRICFICDKTLEFI